jgi:hypothetical protein
VFNPYFTTELYYTQVEVDLWMKRYNDKTFDMSLVDGFKELPKFDEPTEKLLHYTVIFNAFVFL